MAANNKTKKKTQNIFCLMESPSNRYNHRVNKSGGCNHETFVKVALLVRINLYDKTGERSLANC